MAGNRQSSARERHAHFADDLEREENSEKAHEEDELEFKKKQRRRSSVAKLPLGFASLRRLSTASGDCEYLPTSHRTHSPLLCNSNNNKHNNINIVLCSDIWSEDEEVEVLETPGPCESRT